MALPEIGDDVGVRGAELQWVITAYCVAGCTFATAAVPLTAAVVGAARAGEPHLHLRRMSLLEQVQRDARDAMKARERERMHALRLIVSELQKAAKDDGGDEIQVLQRERKRRLEAAEAYRDGGRPDAAAAEEREAEIIASYLPAQLSDEELDAIVGDAVAESGASSPSEMGKVMGLIMPKVQGRADGKRVSALVREKLTA